MPEFLHFERAFALVVIVIPLAVLAYVLLQQRRASAAVRFTNLSLLESVAERTPLWRRHVPAAVFLLGMAILFVGIGQPQSVKKIPVEEATIILTIDVSGSMIAKDIEPTRLAAAQASAKSFVDSLPPKIRVGLVSFNETVRVLSPPTIDRLEVNNAIDRLSALRGTAMGDGLATALELVRPDEIADSNEGVSLKPAPDGTPIDKSKRIPAAIVLLSDGKSTVGNTSPLSAAQLAANLDVPIYAISLGTQDGVAILPGEDGTTQRIPVPPDEPTLRQIAAATGGEFFSAPSAKQLRSVYDDLGSKIGYTKKLTDRTVFPLAIGAAVLAVAAGLSMAWERKLP